MKFISAIIPTLILFALPQVNNAQAHTDWQRMGLKGKVKTITEMSSTQVGYGDANGFATTDNQGKNITEFDEKGCIVRRIWLDKKDKIVRKTLFEYDDSGLKKNAYSFNFKGNDTVRTVSTYYFENNGSTAVIKYFDKQGDLQSKSLVSYDSLGRIIRTVEFYPPDSIYSTTDYEFDGDSLIGWKTQTRNDRAPTQIRIVIEKQDKTGNWTKAAIQFLRYMHAYQSRYREIAYYSD